MADSQGSNLGVLEPIGGGNSIPLLKKKLVVGRRETSDICLKFSNVSTSHCELILEQGYWKVKDLQSTNGVKVNGERVLEKRIYPGDELTIAKHRFRLDYTPTTARSADAEVDDLHEDIMRFSLLERAGLTKQGEPAKETARHPKRTPKDEALEFFGAPVAKSGDSDEGDEFKDIARPARKDKAEFADEGQLDAVSPATSAHDLSDDEFLRIVAEEQKKKKPKDKK